MGGSAPLLNLSNRWELCACLFFMIAWVGGDDVWMVYFAFVLLAVPFCVIWIERKVALRRLPEIPAGAVREWVRDANIWSYVLLVAAAIAYPLAISGHRPNRSVNTDAPPAALRARRWSPVTSFQLTSAASLEWEYPCAMKMATGKVVGGKVVLEGVSTEKMLVTVLARTMKPALISRLSKRQKLLLSIAEADRGETVSAEEVLAKLARRPR